MLERPKEEIELVELRSYKVVKSNEIIQRAKYDLTITELRALAFVLSKIKPNDRELQTYEFTLREYCKVCGLEHSNTTENYKNIKKTFNRMLSKVFWIENESGGETSVHWFEKVSFEKIERKKSETDNLKIWKVKVRLDEDMQKYLLGLYKNFTEYELLSILPMRSSYSFRLYELLKSHSFKKSKKIDLEELKSRIAASHYKQFKDFRKFVLDVAVREINKYTDLQVSYEKVLDGLRVEAIIFDIKKRNVVERYGAARRAKEKLDGQMTIEEYMGKMIQEMGKQ